ncbi:hypothetical protein BDY21DRAFT_374171 [Lineolata rhizophorae]|uniref:Uncharacterized protein n=1 Tax=Lineolata rhizophorae TaxID=578093 RepID=A0A6A6NSK3_9PEZI|nr:hypothetical protein BDY21DRAFT_374171 [Lineolata rhizophorae]
MGPINQQTCTHYESYATTTSFTDCEGCVLATMAMGPGPVVQCGTWVTEPVSSMTVTECFPSPTTAPSPTH